MKILVIEHAPERATGVVRLLQALGVDFELCRLYEGALLPEYGGVSGIIPAGGPMGVGDIGSSEYPFLVAEIEYLCQAMNQGIPVLGICLGHQLIVYGLGGQVRKTTTPEVGWTQVQLTSAGLADPLFAQQPETFPTFHYHFDEVCTLPAEGVVLANSAHCGVQAFRIKDKPIWGVQYHPDIFPDHAARILAAFAQRRPEMMSPVEAEKQSQLGQQCFDIGASSKLIQNFMLASNNRNSFVSREVIDSP